MDIIKAKKIILDYINNNDSLTFAGIEKLLDKHNIDYKGDYLYALNEDYKDIILWTGWSREVIELIESIWRKEELIDASPCHRIFYMADGAFINFPMAEKITHYAEPHWLPVLFTRKEY